jgi:hypothetical protein
MGYGISVRVPPHLLAGRLHVIRDLPQARFVSEQQASIAFEVTEPDRGRGWLRRPLTWSRGRAG